MVYTYSGPGILLLPISGLPSYSFFLSAQLWMTVGLLLTARKIAGLFVNRRHGLLCLALLASVPGIMNMSITAKTDSATALFQLIMIYFLLLYIKRQKTYWLVLAGNAFFMTMVLNPRPWYFPPSWGNGVPLHGVHEASADPVEGAVFPGVDPHALHVGAGVAEDLASHGASGDIGVLLHLE
ncbi:MAG: glycosyltransferase family 39 protein [Enterocloster sp.]